MRFVAMVAGERHVVEVDGEGADRRVTLDGRELALNWRRIGAQSAQLRGESAGHYGMLVGARSYEAYVRAPQETAEADGAGTALEVFVSGHPYLVTVQDARAEALAGVAASVRVSGEATVRAPMPGLVRNVRVSPGDEVERGQIVVVLEAMKMENDLAATRAGVVMSVAVATGQTVNQGDALITIGDSGASADSPDEADDE